MKFWLGITDNSWFDFVSKRLLDEVNFWQPSTRPPFTQLPEGTPFFFKLKRPHNHIAGGGRFVRYTTLPLSMAWDVFEERNGAASLLQLTDLIANSAHSLADPGRVIGCTVVTEVIYLAREAWIPVDGLFPSSGVQVGKSYDSDGKGKELWQRIHASMTVVNSVDGVQEEPARYGSAFLQYARLGQGAFRTLVLDAYGRRCAITGESTLPVLEAAHIRPYSDSGRHITSNGLLLRSDFHKLFDLGLVTVEPDYRIRVSSKIHDQWFNGKAYYRLDKQSLAAVPERSLDQPDREVLRWHNDHRFLS